MHWPALSSALASGTLILQACTHSSLFSLTSSPLLTVDTCANNQTPSPWRLSMIMPGFSTTCSHPSHAPLAQHGENKPYTRDKAYYLYRLSGIVVHTGGSDSGDCYSYTRERRPPYKWYSFNDSSVDEINPSQIAEDCFGGSHT